MSQLVCFTINILSMNGAIEEMLLNNYNGICIFLLMLFFFQFEQCKFQQINIILRNFYVMVWSWERLIKFWKCKLLIQNTRTIVTQTHYTCVCVYVHCTHPSSCWRLNYMVWCKYNEPLKWNHSCVMNIFWWYYLAIYLGTNYYLYISLL